MAETTIAELVRRVTALEQAVLELRNTGKPQPGTCVKGKYKGKKLEDVVASDPEYVVWLADNGYAQGIGFDDPHIIKARQLATMAPIRTDDEPPWAR